MGQKKSRAGAGESDGSDRSGSLKNKAEGLDISDRLALTSFAYSSLAM